MRLLTVIPARGGSKGLPRKNILPLAGKPLLAYSIEAAGKCRADNRIVVSTDDPEIAAIAKEHGAEIPFLRPGELAGSEANLAQALDYTVRRLQEDGYSAQAIMILLPTSPFRNPRLMNGALARLASGHQSVTTVKNISLERQSFYTLDNATGLGKKTGIRAGCATRCFRSYGILSCYMTSPAILGHYAHPIEDPAMFIDIDTQEDLALAEQIIAMNLFDFDAS